MYDRGFDHFENATNIHELTRQGEHAQYKTQHMLFSSKHHDGDRDKVFGDVKEILGSGRIFIDEDTEGLIDTQDQGLYERFGVHRNRQQNLSALNMDIVQE